MEDRIRPILEAGFGAHQAGELEIAEGNYRHALEIDPANADALHLLGVALMQKGETDAAIASIRQSLDSDSDNPSALDQLGVLLADIGELKEALAAFEQALAMAPDYGACWRNLGHARELARDWTGALDAYEQAIALEPDYAAAHASLGAARLETGAFADALDAFDKSLALDPAQPGVAVKRAEALRGLKRIDEAIAVYQDVYADRAQQTALARALGFCHMEAGDDGEALRHFTRALELQPDGIDAGLSAAACHMRRNELAMAAEKLDTLLAASPGHRQALAYRTILHHLAHEHEAANALTYLDRDIAIGTLPIPDGYADAAEFNNALAGALTANPTLRYDPHAKSTQGGRQSGELALYDDPAVAGFFDVLLPLLRDRLASMERRPDHPHFAAIPEDFRLDCWSTILDAEGHQLPHTHPGAWMSGVYYVQVAAEVRSDDESHAGWIEFGAAGYGLPAHDGPLRLGPPEVGHVVLFPSYFLHRTVPFQSTTQRISIAFDLVPTD